MKIEQIIYLKDIAQTHSITQTAQRFFISQQALSFALKKLEEEFGTIFLERTNRGAELTEDGVLFLERARTMVDTYGELQDFFRGQRVAFEKTIELAGTLCIYSHTRVLEPLLVGLLEQYSRKYPSVSIALHERENISILETIAQREGDFGILFAPDFLLEERSYRLPPQLALSRLFSDEFIVCCNHNHPLTQEKILQMGQFPDVPMVLFDTNAYVLSPELTDQPLKNSCQYFSNNMSFHKAMIRRGLAVSVITAFEFRKLYLKHKDLTALPIADSPKSVITLAVNQEREMTTAARCFIAMLEKYDFYGL